MTSIALPVARPAATALTAIDPLVEKFFDNPPIGGASKLFGFTYADPEKKDDVFERNRRKFQTDRAELTRRLEVYDLKPISVIPTAFWDRIIQSHKLYDLAPDQNGQIRMYPDSAADEAKKNWFRTMPWQAIGGACVASWFALRLWGNPWMVNDNQIDGAMMLAATIFTGGIGWLGTLGAERVIARLFFGGRNKLHARACALLYVKQKGRLAVVSQLLQPDGHEPETVSVKFPEPPADVIEVLRKAQGFGGLRVVVEDGAVAFSPSPQHLIARRINRKLRLDREERLAALADPIITCVHGSAVAILAQFGDCPIEEKALRKAITMDTLKEG